MKQILLIAFLITTLIGCTVVESDPISRSKELTWTAAGDDGMLGQAQRADVRWTYDTTLNFSDWNVIDSTHYPAPGGQSDSLTATILVETGVNVYFAIKTADEVPNWSLLSNIAVRNWDDVTAPSGVVDLVFVFRETKCET